MTVIIGSARIDENGSAHGGKAGDQTGKEVSTQNWYRHPKGWILLRPKDSTQAEKIASCMLAACKNNNIGYDQYQRLTLYDAAKEVNFDCAKVTNKVETDCSALVRVCCAFAGIHTANFRTSNEVSVLMKTGMFDKYTESAYTARSDRLKRGDILVTKTKGHTVVVVSDGANAEQSTPLKTAPKTVIVTGGTVYVRKGAGTGFPAVGIARRGECLPYVSTAENGWYRVIRNDTECYITNKYTKLE